MIHRSLRAVALLAVAALTIAATPPNRNWSATVARNADGSYTLGNPAAKLKVTEYVSYTCPHCAHFQAQADAPLRQSYLPKGDVSVTVQQILRNQIDVTVAMLTSCGDPKRFFRRHSAFMSSQDTWLAKFGGFSDADKALWGQGDIPQRLRTIAKDFGFYATMAQWGYSQSAVDKCLGDAAMLKRLEAQTEQAGKRGVDSTPSFAINGDVLTGTHEWSLLAAQIDARL